MHLPHLALQALRPRWCEPLALAVTERAQVVAVSALAAAQGARIGMRSSSVQTVAPLVILQERDCAREHDARNALALSLLQYTPELAAAEEASFLLDVTASLSAFGGRLTLCRRVRESVQAMGFSVQLGMAPTAQAACLFALQRRGLRRALRMTSMQRRLDRLPLSLLPAAGPHADWLTGIACHTLAELRRLPRTGLKRRGAAALLEQLDRAYGSAPELFDWIQAPDCFTARLELPYRIEQTDSLLFAVRRLVMQMTGWLVAQQQAVCAFALVLEHERARQRIAPTAIVITLNEPAWQEAHLLRLLKERLGRLTLTAPVIALRLDTQQLSALAVPTLALFPEPGGAPEEEQRLLELLVARLGPDALHYPSPRPDHRPEVANQWQHNQTAAQVARRTGARNTSTTTAPAARPFWLLDKPVALLLRGHHPFYGSPLRLISGPERIESGWWDGALVLRDYFVAEGEEGACYWIYRERDAGSARWFLHGLFA